MKKKVKKRLDYQLARERILTMIQQENYAVGDVLPSTNRLVRMLRIGLKSVQRALPLLTEEGLIRKVRGS